MARRLRRSPGEALSLHAELAREFDGRWGYRRLETLSVVASARRPLGSASRLVAPDWVAQEAIIHQCLGTTATTAQIHPAQFTRGMMEAAIARGARLQIGCATGMELSSDDGGRFRGVVVDSELTEGDAVVIAMGPWSAVASQWMPMPMVYGLKGHSVILRNPIPVSPHALFVECEAEDGSVDTQRWFPRPDGTTYVCGLSSEEPLPLDPAQVTSHAGAQVQLKAMIRTFAPALADAYVVAAQACYRPVTRDGLPIMGRVPGIEGAYVATGHSVWGMLNAPATGEAEWPNSSPRETRGRSTSRRSIRLGCRRCGGIRSALEAGREPARQEQAQEFLLAALRCALNASATRERLDWLRRIAPWTSCEGNLGRAAPDRKRPLHFLAAIPRGRSPQAYCCPINSFAGRPRLSPPWGVPACAKAGSKRAPLALTYRWRCLAEFQTRPSAQDLETLTGVHRKRSLGQA